MALAAGAQAVAGVELAAGAAGRRGQKQQRRLGSSFSAAAGRERALGLGAAASISGEARVRLSGTGAGAAAGSGNSWRRGLGVRFRVSLDRIPKQSREEKLKDGVREDFANFPNNMYALNSTQMDMVMTEDSSMSWQSESVMEETISSGRHYKDGTGVWNLSDLDGTPTRLSVSGSSFSGAAAAGGRERTLGFGGAVSICGQARGRLGVAGASATAASGNGGRRSFGLDESSSNGGSREWNSKGSGKSGASSVSSGVRLEHISKTFKGQTVLQDVSWEVKKGEKVGLVGVNGAGKTTQLRIIAGQEDADSGTVVKAKNNMKIAFLTQEFEVVPSRTVREEFQSAFAEQMTISSKIEKVQTALESATDDMDLMSRLLDELDRLQKQAEAAEMYDVDVKINKIMAELSFSMEDADRLVAAFSGGWQMRMSLGKILLQEPDLLLLDEPTNHLDLDTIEWLEGYLKKQDVPMVLVSHDRAFLDQLCTKIVETDLGISRTFEGNYSEYVNAKAAWIEAKRLAWEKQQKEIARTEDLIQRLSGGANSGRATSAEKQLDKMQDGQIMEKPFEAKHMKFRFPELERSGKTVLEINHLCHRYDDNILFDDAKLLIERGEKVAIIGPNGCGKSTLLRFVLELEDPTAGDVDLGEYRVVPNYFEQNQAEALDSGKTVLQVLEEAAEDWRLNDIKGLLGRCNFKADMMHRKVSFLSGGEKARLALCKFMVTPSTLLVLDEPTNHLDIPSKEMLEEALREFKGSVIAVSHDRYFLRQIVNRVVEVKDRKLQDYAGDYNYYLEQNLEARKQELDREAELEAKAPTVKAKSKMTKAERVVQKKQKATSFQASKSKGKVSKNAKRWN